jgi:hypothetical protein
MKRCLPIALLIAACQFAHAQDVVLDAGPRFQKAIGLYYENGISVSYSAKKLLNDKLYLGFSYYTSRLGTAIN